ncbi:MAG: bifunctional methylenetetrahydrofolate dehydrogenase/methenyltetrahydrofolate cyclohydrolase FolD [Christensenellales bacterium]|jgi:methylenetetrahydrofolate dehydrogenase (NADP+)/methenyltetrahydrofolate cyclohydrolase
MAIRICGKEISDHYKQAMKSAIDNLKGRKPGLAVIICGDNPASQVYVGHKVKDCEQTGIISYKYAFPSDVASDEVIAQIKKLNSDTNIDGILVQVPLPKHLDEKVILNTIAPDKDVDGFGIESAGLLSLGVPRFISCTPLGIIKLLEYMNIELAGKYAVMVGRSNIVGKPMAQLLLMNNCTVTICHSKTNNIKKFTSEADILIAAVGKAHFITADMVKPGAVIVDVGMNRLDGRLTGDVDYDGVEKVAGYITPVPGGVGLMTRAMLLYNTLKAYEYHESVQVPLGI